MSWTVLIDGYNVLRHWPQFEREWQQSWERARERLIRMVINYAAYEGHRVTLVFDGRFTDQPRAERKRQHGIEIVYTAQNETADEYIVQRIGKLPPTEHAEVITSDRELAHLARQAGADVLTTFEFQDTYARTGGKEWGHELPDADPRLTDRLDLDVRRQLEALKRQLPADRREGKR